MSGLSNHILSLISSDVTEGREENNGAFKTGHAASPETEKETEEEKEKRLFRQKQAEHFMRKFVSMLIKVKHMNLNKKIKTNNDSLMRLLSLTQKFIRELEDHSEETVEETIEDIGKVKTEEEELKEKEKDKLIQKKDSMDMINTMLDILNEFSSLFSLSEE